MTLDALNAANAYRNQQKLMQGERATPEETAASSSFGQMVEQALGDAAASAGRSEALQAASITTGKVELAELVTAVAEAELSLNTVVAIRDRVINAYNDIVKMTI